MKINGMIKEWNLLVPGVCAVYAGKGEVERVTANCGPLGFFEVVSPFWAAFVA